MRGLLLASTAVALLSAASVSYADLTADNLFVLSKHDGPGCLTFTTDKTGATRFAITHRSKANVLGGPDIDPYPNHDTASADVIAHYLANKPFQHFQWNPALAVICEGNPDPAYIVTDLDAVKPSIPAVSR